MENEEVHDSTETAEPEAGGQFLTGTALFSQHAGRTPRARLTNPVSWTHRSESILLVCQRMCMNPGAEGSSSVLLIVASVIRRQNLPTRNKAKING